MNYFDKLVCLGWFIDEYRNKRENIGRVKDIQY